MFDAAPVVGFDKKGQVTREHPGFSVLDIAKHAALTVLETLDGSDRLGIVKFSDQAEVLQELEFMNSDNKLAADGLIRGLEVENSTNLWQGILKGINLFKDQESSGRNPAILLLTDGQPNGQVPLQGYVGSIQNMTPLPAAIHTFGFGNDIMSDLLKSIAEVGGGNYSFIPDAGMVGTVFVNAVAHLQSTFANRCILKLTCDEKLSLQNGSVEETAGSKGQDDLDTLTSGLTLRSNSPQKRSLIIPLGNIHYGQSRTVYFSSSHKVDWNKMHIGELAMSAELSYLRMGQAQFVVKAQRNGREATSLPDWKVSYHQSRAMICRYLSSFFPLGESGERKAVDLDTETMVSARERFDTLCKNIPAKDFDDAYNKSLMQDLQGQVKLAVFDNDYLCTWGLHYFLSLWDAHVHQMRNTFKDPGVQQYDVDSPLFLGCQKKLISAFDTSVRPPEPSLRSQADGKYSDGRATVSMSSYNRSDNPCFSASSMVTLATGQDVAVSILREGSVVQTAAGGRKVAVVLRTRVREVIMCRINKSLLITPYHPIVHKGSWTFPAFFATGAVVYSGTVYSILLEPDADAQAHTLRMGGTWATTLGHGITSGMDARAHCFLGNYTRISKALTVLGIGSNGIAVSSGVIRDKRSKKLKGFKKICPSSAQLEA
ncbi:hypothetical protein E8E14_009537 [Neopestalotiopsis sp. 37M]|nr:hypothetical protein E8E14_009537 [Neopestalotiopsis sp. 37M]